MPPSIAQDASNSGLTLSFSQDEFLALVEDAESFVKVVQADLGTDQSSPIQIALLDAHLSHMVTELCEKKVNFLAYIQDYTANWDEHSFLFALSKCANEDGTLDSDKIDEIMPVAPAGSPTTNNSTELPLANVFTGFPTADMFGGLLTVGLVIRPPAQPINLLSHEQAVELVRGLEHVNISSILPEDMYCSHCWGNYDDDTNPGNNEPVKLPCGHIVGFDCLVQCLEQVGPHCSLCRQNIVELAAQASQHN